MEDKDKRKGWLRELKVGDEIAVNCGNYGYADYRILKVKKNNTYRQNGSW